MAAANTAQRTNRPVLTVAAANIAARTHPQARRNTCLTNVARTDRPVQPVLTVPTVAAANTAPRTNRPVLTVATANIAAMTDRPVQPILEGMQNERLQSGVVQNDGFPQNGGFVRDVVAASSHALIVSPVSLDFNFGWI